MIEKLLAGSKTFEQKTEFSKEKHMKRLINKYHTYIELRFPNLKEVSLHYEKCLQMNSIRHDMLAFMLNLAEVRHDSKVLVLENTRGLVLAGCIQRVNQHPEQITVLIPQKGKKTVIEQDYPALVKINGLNFQGVKV